MPAVKTPIGERLYLFTDGTGTPAACLVISSHGAYVPGRNSGPEEGNGWFRVPAWTTLDFFVPHGEKLEDPTLGNIGRYAPTESYGPGVMVRNYRLAKYQGSHGSQAETYADILQRIDENRGLADRQDQVRAAATQAERDSGLIEPIRRFDALTIRYRVPKTLLGVTLRDVLQELDRHGHRYARIRCSFCRSSILGDKPWTSLNHTPESE